MYLWANSRIAHKYMYHNNLVLIKHSSLQQNHSWKVSCAPELCMCINLAIIAPPEGGLVRSMWRHSDQLDRDSGKGMVHTKTHEYSWEYDICRYVFLILQMHHNGYLSVKRHVHCLKNVESLIVCINNCRKCVLFLYQFLSSAWAIVGSQNASYCRSICSGDHCLIWNYEYHVTKLG